jgi:hypothetical protein
MKGVWTQQRITMSEPNYRYQRFGETRRAGETGAVHENLKGDEDG